MHTRLALVATLAALAAAVPASAAPTSAPVVDSACYLVGIQSASVTGEHTYTSQAVGWATAVDPVLYRNPVDVSIRCYVTVNGVEVGYTRTESGLGAAAVRDRIDFQTVSGDVVEICAEVSTDGGAPQTTCWGTAVQEPLPTDVLLELLQPLCGLPIGDVVCAIVDVNRGYVVYGPPLG